MNHYGALLAAFGLYVLISRKNSMGIAVSVPLFFLSIIHLISAFPNEGGIAVRAQAVVFAAILLIPVVSVAALAVALKVFKLNRSLKYSSANELKG